MIEQGAELNIKDFLGATPVLYAAESGHPKIVKLLIDNHAFYDSVDSSDKTPFQYAIDKGIYYIKNCIINRSAELNSVYCNHFHRFRRSRRDFP